MSSLDSWGDYETPCFQQVVSYSNDIPVEMVTCGGVVHHFYFDSDCSYNPSSSGIYCKKCNHSYTQEEWGDRK